MSRYKHIALCGSISIDRIMNFSGKYKDIIQPEKLHILSISVLINKLQNSHGGIAANIAYSLALLGEKATIVASIGNDGKEYLSEMKKYGIDVSHIHISKLPTSTFTVLTDQSDNQVGGFFVGAMKDNASLSLKTFNKNHTLVVISADDPKAMNAHVKECQSLKIPYMYDIGQQVILLSKNEIQRAVRGAEIVIFNDYERAVICKKMNISEAALLKTVPTCVTTLGDKGSRIEGTSIEKPIHIPAVKIIKLVDPTGAGDAYRAGFLYGYIHGQSLPVCGQLGTVSAAYAVEKYGTQEHHFTMKQFQRRYKQAFHRDMPNIQEEHENN